VPVNIISKSGLKCCLSDAEGGTQDVIFFGTAVNKVARLHRL
jgi:hypothetical protein